MGCGATDLKNSIVAPTIDIRDREAEVSEAGFGSRKAGVRACVRANCVSSVWCREGRSLVSMKLERSRGEVRLVGWWGCGAKTLWLVAMGH